MKDYRLRSYEDARIRPWDAWSINVCVQNHFKSEKFSAFRVGFKLPNCNAETIAKKPEGSVYARIASRFPLKDQCITYCLANVLDGKTYVRQYTDNAMLELEKRWDSLSKRFEDDCNKLSSDRMDVCLKSANGDTPPIILKWLEGSIDIETVVILDNLTHFLRHADKKVSDRILWPDLYMKLSKYQSFLTELDYPKFKDIALSSFSKRG